MISLKKPFKVLLTSVITLSLILTMLTPLAPNKVAAANDVTVNLSSEKQVIRGFGGMNHPSWAGDLTAAQRETAFGNGDNQLGFSILRIYVDGDRNNWYKELATAKRATQLGAIVFASPWNPPSDMTETFNHNGDTTAKRLRYDKYAAYAQYLNDFVTYMKNNGVDLYAISVQNEPDYAYDWTWWTPAEMLNFMKNYAGSINCKVIAPESFSYLKNMSDPILNDSQALANMDILGAHLYGTSYSNFSYPLFQQKASGKDLWMTEVYYPNSTSSADTWPEALDVSYHMYNALVEGNFNAYVWWYIRRSYGPMKEDGSISKRGYCMAQYSKFVRSGYKRVDATKNPNTNVYVSAYTGDNKVVIVAINKGTTDTSQKFNLSNSSVTKMDRWRTSANENMVQTNSIDVNSGSFWANLPAQSVSTFVGTISSSSSTSTSTPTSTSTLTPTSSANTMGATAKLSDGWYYIKNVNAQKYLQVKDNTGKAAQNVEIGTGSGVAGQKWYLTNTSDGYITLKSALGNYMLDVANGTNSDGANIQIYTSNSANAQKFCLKSTSTTNTYTIATIASNQTKMIDVYNFGKTDGTNVCQWTYGGYSNQQWTLEKTSYSDSGSTTTPTASSSPASTSTSSASSGSLPSGITCEYKVVSDWGSSFQGQITLKNSSSTTYNGWTLSFNYNSTINNLWGASLSSQSGTKVVIKNSSWDTTLAPGSSVTINFTAALGSDKNTPTSYSFS